MEGRRSVAVTVKITARPGRSAGCCEGRSALAARKYRAGMSELDVPDSAVTPAGARLLVAGGDAGLDARLSAELDAHNVAASGVGDQQELTVQVLDADGDLVAGLSGWTWGTCAGIAMLWVRADSRSQRWGARLLDAAEQAARERGCRQMTVSSFTFQAPDFYRRHGYVETGRTEGLPVDGAADVHFRKALVGDAG